MWQYSIQRHQDNDYDLIITILPENVEFGSDLFSAERKEKRATIPPIRSIANKEIPNQNCKNYSIRNFNCFHPIQCFCSQSGGNAIRID